MSDKLKPCVFPPPTKNDAKHGWAFSYKFLTEVHDLVVSRIYDADISMEDVEAVLAAVRTWQETPDD